MMKQQLLFLALGILAAVCAVAAEPAAHRPEIESLAHACAGCHGTYGHSLPPTPAIAGKPEDEFINAMRDFKSGKRISSIMNRIARAYTEEDIANLAHFFNSR